MSTTTFRAQDASVFSMDTIMAARKRQGEHCAACGVNLATVEAWAHSLEPLVNPRDELDNCMVICGTCDHSLAPGSQTGKVQHASRTRTMFGFWEASTAKR